LFKKFHPRINRTSLFFTSSTLSNYFQATKSGPWGLNSMTSKTSLSTLI
jgi:hypothetical protein